MMQQKIVFYSTCITQFVSAVTVSSAEPTAVLLPCHLAHHHWDPVMEACRHIQYQQFQRAQTSNSITL